MAFETDDLAAAPTFANAALALELILEDEQRDEWVEEAVANAVKACDQLGAAFVAEPFCQAAMADSGIADACFILEQWSHAEQAQERIKRTRTVLAALQDREHPPSREALESSKNFLGDLADAITTGRQLARRLNYSFSG